MSTTSPTPQLKQESRFLSFAPPPEKNTKGDIEGVNSINTYRNLRTENGVKDSLFSDNSVNSEVITTIPCPLCSGTLHLSKRGLVRVCDRDYLHNFRAGTMEVMA